MLLANCRLGITGGIHSKEALLLCKAKPSRVPLPEPALVQEGEVFTFQALRAGTSITFDYTSSTGAVTQSTSYTFVVPSSTALSTGA